MKYSKQHMQGQMSTARSVQKQPLVSIVLPTYNGAKYLQQSIESCLSQSYENLELIVVVDGSTDETETILEEFSDLRMKIVHHKRNRGLPEGLNTGFTHTQGALLTWTSDDNWYAPDAIAEMAGFLGDHPEVGFVYADMWLVDEEGQTQELDVLPPEHLKTQLMNGIYACFLYRREVYEAIGDYDPATRLAEDYDYWLRIAERYEIAALHRRHYYYRQHAGSLTGVHGRYGAARRILKVRRNRKWIGWREYLYWSAYLDIDAAFWHKQQGNWDQVRRMGVRGLVKNPAHVRNIGFLSILGESILGNRVTSLLRRAVRRLWKTDSHLPQGNGKSGSL